MKLLRNSLAAVVVAAWGALKTDVERVLADRVWELLAGRDVRSLGTTKDGSPRHPSRLAHATALVAFGATR